MTQERLFQQEGRWLRLRTRRLARQTSDRRISPGRGHRTTARVPGPSDIPDSGTRDSSPHIGIHLPAQPHTGWPGKNTFIESSETKPEVTCCADTKAIVPGKGKEDRARTRLGGASKERRVDEPVSLKGWQKRL